MAINTKNPRVTDGHTPNLQLPTYEANTPLNFMYNWNDTVTKIDEAYLTEKDKTDAILPRVQTLEDEMADVKVEQGTQNTAIAGNTEKINEHEGEIDTIQNDLIEQNALVKGLTNNVNGMADTVNSNKTDIIKLKRFKADISLSMKLFLAPISIPTNYTPGNPIAIGQILLTEKRPQKVGVISSAISIKYTSTLVSRRNLETLYTFPISVDTSTSSTHTNVAVTTASRNVDSGNIDYDTYITLDVSYNDDVLTMTFYLLDSDWYTYTRAGSTNTFLVCYYV